MPPAGFQCADNSRCGGSISQQFPAQNRPILDGGGQKKVFSGVKPGVGCQVTEKRPFLNQAVPGKHLPPQGGILNFRQFPHRHRCPGFTGEFPAEAAVPVAHAGVHPAQSLPGGGEQGGSIARLGQLLMGYTHQLPAESLASEGRGGGDSIEVGHFLPLIGAVQPMKGSCNLPIPLQIPAAFRGIGGSKEAVNGFRGIRKALRPELFQLVSHAPGPPGGMPRTFPPCPPDCRTALPCAGPPGPDRLPGSGRPHPGISAGDTGQIHS